MNPARTALQIPPPYWRGGAAPARWIISVESERSRTEKINLNTPRTDNNKQSDMISDVRVSVWVITYNHAKFIGKCLDSILEQETTFEFEICLGEDESNDGTREICEKYARSYPEIIRFFPRFRNDPARADCAGAWQYNFIETFKCCRGKYIATCDGDDFWADKNKLQMQVDLLERHPEYAGCFHKIGTVDADGNITRADNGYPPRRMPNYSLDYLLRYGNFSPMFSVVFRNHENVAPAWICGAPFGDMIVHAGNLRHGNYGFIDRVMGYYRIHDSGLASGTSRLKNVDATLTVHKLIGKHFGLQDRPSYRQGLRALRVSYAIESILSRLIPPRIKSRLDRGVGRKLRAFARRILAGKDL
jgi:glycosyltransferase involved in cell wall biosynthesis